MKPIQLQLPAFNTFKYLILSLTLLSFTHSSAQILKVNKGAATLDSSGYFSGEIGLNLAINNRNSTANEQVLFTQFRQKGDASYTSVKHIYYLIDDVRYFQSTGGPIQSTGYAHARVNLLRKKKLSYELFAQGQYDQGRNLDARLLIGAGLRYRILEHLAYGLGAMYESEEWERISAEGKIIKQMPKMSTYLTGRIDFSKRASLSLTGYYQTGFDTDDDIWRNRVSLDTSLDVFLASKLDLSLGYSLTYEDRPVIEISKTVYAYGTGIKYRF